MQGVFADKQPLVALLLVGCLKGGFGFETL